MSHTLYIDGRFIGHFAEESDALKFRDISGGKRYSLHCFCKNGNIAKTMDGMVPSPKVNLPRDNSIEVCKDNPIVIHIYR